MSTWRPCPNGCGKDVRAYWPDGVFDGEPTPDANDCLWCEGSFTSGAAVLGGLMGMAEAIRDMCACGKPAVWNYAPKGGDYCEGCVSRGCSCNIDPDTGVEDTDEQGRLLPCCEYMYTGPPAPTKGEQ